MGCRLPGELGRGGHAAAGTCNLYAELFGIRERQGSKGAKGTHKEVGGASGQGSEKRRVTGRVKQPRSSFVCPRLSKEVIGIRDENRKEREV